MLTLFRVSVQALFIHREIHNEAICHVSTLTIMAGLCGIWHYHAKSESLEMNEPIVSFAERNVLTLIVPTRVQPSFFGFGWVRYLDEGV